MTERRAAERHAVVLPALCWGRGRSDFYAVTIDISAEGILLRSAVRPAVGEILICSIRHVGQVETEVVRTETSDFAVRLRGRRPAPGIVAKRMVDLAQQQRQKTDPIRVHRRIVPKRTQVEIRLDDGGMVTGRVLNLSASGVALSLDAPLAIGQTIVVGRTPARVARLFAHGAGAAFLTPFDLDAIHEDAAL